MKATEKRGCIAAKITHFKLAPIAPALFPCLSENAYYRRVCCILSIDPARNDGRMHDALVCVLWVGRKLYGLVLPAVSSQNLTEEVSYGI